MRALVVGGDGMVGHHLKSQLFASDVAVIATTRRRPSSHHGYLDLTSSTLDSDFVKLTREFKPTVVFIVAAITKVVDCDADAAMAWKVNADAPAQIAMVSRMVFNAHPVFVSSDAVVRAPHMVYSMAKAYAELAVRSYQGVIVRCPRIPPDKCGKLCNFLIEMGEKKALGLKWWDPSQDESKH